MSIYSEFSNGRMMELISGGGMGWGGGVMTDEN